MRIPKMVSMTLYKRITVNKLYRLNSLFNNTLQSIIILPLTAKNLKGEGKKYLFGEGV